VQIGRRRALFGLATAGVIAVASPSRAGASSLGTSLRQTMAQMPTRPPQHWLVMAMSASATEVAAGCLAVERADNADAKQFGQMMLADHGMALDELAKMATTMGAPAVQGPVVDVHTMMSMALMEAPAGPESDRMYMRSMVLAHRMDTAEYELAAREQTPEIVAHATKAISVLRNHLQMALDISGRVGADLLAT
jgi:putative membrane protein